MAVERRDFNEVEIKVLPQGRFSRVLELSAAAAPAGARLLRNPHIAIFDLYFDTPSLALAEAGAYLRVRFSRASFRKKGTYRLYFKQNVPAPAAAHYLVRREVRTDLRRKEVLRLGGGGTQAAAASLARETALRAGDAGPLAPVCLISSFRRTFTVRAGSGGPPYDDVLSVLLEHSTAFAARDLDTRTLLETGYVDAPLFAPTYDFELAEAELLVEGRPDADAMFAELVDGLAAEFPVLRASKYLDTLHGLGLRPDPARPPAPQRIRVPAIVRDPAAAVA